MQIKKGDQVEVITGKEADKGKRGEVIKVLPKENRVVVQGINMKTKHQRQVQSEGKTINPGIVKKEGSIDASNVMLVCKKCGKAVRVGISREDDKPIRVCKNCGALID
jgi:large subunit ribosomal protein L24